MNVGNSERLDVLQWLDGYSLVAASMTSKLLKAVVERHRGILPLRVVGSCVLSQCEYLCGEEEPTALCEDWGSDQFATDGVMQFDLALHNATPMIAHESKPHPDACRAFSPAFKLLRHCALGSLAINDGGYEAQVTSSMTRMLQEFLRRVPVRALTLSHATWSHGFNIVDVLPMARGLEQVTLVECDAVPITNKVLEDFSSLGIAYVDIRFDALFEPTDEAIFSFLLGNNKICSNSGRRELHLSNVVVSDGFFRTMIETFLDDKSSTPVILAVEGNRIVDDAAFDADDSVRIEENWAYTRFGFDRCPSPFEVLFNRNRIELYRACPPENSKLINEVNVAY